MMKNDDVVSFFLRSGIILLLVLSLLVIVLPVRGAEIFFIPIIFTLLGISIAVLFSICEVKFQNKSGNLFSVSGGGCRSMILWYLSYGVYLEILTFAQYYFNPLQALPSATSSDIFLLLSAAPFAVALLYPWLSAQINMMRQTDRDYGSGILVDCAIFYRRHKIFCQIFLLVNVVIVSLYILCTTGKTDPNSIGWILASHVDGSFFLSLLIIVDPILITCYVVIAENRIR